MIHQLNWEGKDMKYDWQPPRFGEKRDNEVTCWAFGITHGMRDVPRVAKKLKELDKLVGVYPDMLMGTLAIFRSKSDAVYGRNVIKEDFPCGGISEVYVEEKYLGENAKE